MNDCFLDGTKTEFKYGSQIKEQQILVLGPALHWETIK